MKFLVSVFLLLGVASASLPAQTPTVDTFARLGGDPDGYHPRSPLVDGLDGYFYGTTAAGGPGNLGTVYKVAPDGTFATIYIFTGGSDGSNPVAGLVRGGDGNLYGTTPGVFPLNSGHSGTIFRVTPAGAFTTVYRFSALDTSLHNADGGFPAAGLTRGSDGILYGVAQYGGSTGSGTAFRLTTGGVFTVLGNFDATDPANASLPTTALVEGDGGNFYGTTRTGGAASAGTFYRVTPGPGIATLHSFNGGTDGGFPDTALVRAADGNFYGATQAGTLYQATAAGAITTIHKLVTNPEGANPSALVPDAAGNLYGTTNSRGPNGYGTYFQVTTAGALTVIASLTDGGKLGYVPNALVRGGDGNFYGAITDTGIGQAGTICRFAPTGGPATLHAFTAGGKLSTSPLTVSTNGSFYGATVSGGAGGVGTLFSVSRDGIVATQHSFADATEGANPDGGIVGDGFGRYFGFTRIDGPGTSGTLFEADEAGATAKPGSVPQGITPSVDDLLVKKVAATRMEQTAKLGHNPPKIQPPVLPSSIEIRLKTLQQSNGENGFGTVSYERFIADRLAGQRTYGVQPQDTEPVLTETVAYQFTGGTDGSFPRGAPLLDAAGNLYGTASAGGAAGCGTVFQLTDAGVFTLLYFFTGAGDGASPGAGLTLGSDGAYYGTTRFSNAQSVGSGTIFRLTPGGRLTTLHTFAADGSEGAQALGELIQAGDGNFYGTTSAGGAAFSGTVFSITPGGTFTKLHDFTPNSGDGGSPAAALVQGVDGNLYGTTRAGGTDGCGIVFRVNVAPPSSFFDGQVALSNGVYYLSFLSGNYFGYYSYLSDPHYVYHFDLGYEYVFDAADGKAGVYLYDFKSNGFFYTAPTFPFPYLYDFSLNSVVYYYPDPDNVGRYNTDGYRFFYVFGTGQIIVK